MKRTTFFVSILAILSLGPATQACGVVRKRGHAEPANVKVTSASSRPWRVLTARGSGSWWWSGPRLRGCRHLPRRRDADAVERFRHQDRSLVAHLGVEQGSSRPWVMAPGKDRSDTRRWLKRCAAVRDELDRYRPRRRQRQLRDGSPREGDFAYRSEHEMTVTAKAIVNAYYGNAPKFSYWTGCSAGGRQAMKAAQMFPGDFDGIIAGSLVSTGRVARPGGSHCAGAAERRRGLPLRAQVLHSAVVAACDGLDGVKDGLIENPLACKFDPGVLACKVAKSRRA